jgi:acetoin utilization protein AcuC
MTKTAFLFTEEFFRFDYGENHPFKISRLKLSYDLIRAFGLLSLPHTHYVEAIPATDEEILLFHDKEYVEVLKAAGAGVQLPYAYFYGLGSGDNPVFKGVYDWSRLVTGASIQAATLVDNEEVDIAFNMAGGLHHAMTSRASGFCYINDIVIAILSLLRKGRRVAYIDIDAHHGRRCSGGILPNG